MRVDLRLSFIFLLAGTFFLRPQCEVPQLSTPAFQDEYPKVVFIKFHESKSGNRGQNKLNILEKYLFFTYLH